MDNYLIETKVYDKTEKEKENELLMSIIRVKKKLEEANKNFQFAEGDLIDYYTYEIKANRAKFNYLIKQAKFQGMEINLLKQLELKLRDVV